MASKTSRRTASKGNVPSNALHMVSAFAAGMGVVLGQTATAEKSNEITAIPELLSRLALEGCVVTIDAMGTQTAIAHTGIPRVYVLGVGRVIGYELVSPRMEKSPDCRRSM